VLADHVVRYLQRRTVGVTRNQATGTVVADALDARLNQWDKERRATGRWLAYDTSGTADEVAPLLRRPDASAWRG
jgi:hypothetical protein